ncbi:MAG: hypothetical protein ACK5PZ_04110, partial [Pirellula sp.]
MPSSWRSVVRDLFLLLAFLVIGVSPVLALQEAIVQAQDGKSYERVKVDEDAERMVLQFPVRRFERKDPPG